MGRQLFAVILAVAGLLYIGLCIAALNAGVLETNRLGGLIVLLIAGVAAAFGSFSLLKQKTNR